jgi:hypothetical protein
MLSVLGVAFVAGGYAAVLLALSPDHQPSADSHYHFAVAREIAGGTLVPDVGRALPFTVLHEIPVDHYWGYHLLLAPFARVVGDAELGMKVATVVLFASLFASAYVFLESRGVAHAWAWALAPACFSTQDWRYLQLRGGQLIVPLLYALAHFAFFEPRARRRRAALVALSYVALLSYHGGIVLLPFHVGGVLSLWLLRRSELAPGQIFEPALTALGAALGLTLNPYMDARASTWRFFALHVGEMGRDTKHLYDDQEIAEFHGFPAKVFWAHPEWLLLFVLLLVAAGYVIARRRTIARDAIVLTGMALTSALLTAQAMRTREYSVPMAFALVAVLGPRRAPAGLEPRASSSRLVAALAALLLGAALVFHIDETLPLIATHLPTSQYRGARPLLEANGDRPVLNIAEADYCMLRWEYDRVVCVQALSRYFIYPYPELFHDIWVLHDHAASSPETRPILRRFWDRGVRLVAVHRTSGMMQFAEAHPEVLRPVFRSKANGATIFALEEAGLSGG